MLEKPNLQDDKVVSCLRASYGLSVTALEFLPIGKDSSAWVYRVRAADETNCFLKVKRGTVLLTLAYYRSECVVQEIGDNEERIFFMSDVGVETKADAVHGHRSQSNKRHKSETQS